MYISNDQYQIDSEYIINEQKGPKQLTISIVE